MERERARGWRWHGKLLGGGFLLVALLLTTLWIPSPASGTIVPETPTPAPNGEGSASELAKELPPPDLPTTNQQGYTFDLKASLKVDLDSIDTEAPVYRFSRDPLSEKEAQKLADRLKIDAKVEKRGDGGFVASGEGDLFVSPDVVQYLSVAQASKGDLPSDDDAISAAREWLRTAGLTPPDLGAAVVTGRTKDSKRLVVQFSPTEPKNLLAAYPSISITIDPSGTILEAEVRWGTVERADLYKLRPAKDAWQEIQSGQGYIDADLSGAKVDPGSPIEGSVTYNDVSIAYTTAGPPGSHQYLEPVFVFKGRLRIDGHDATYAVEAYVPALSNSGAPVGMVEPGAILA
ncbi:MAG TPA: hypothetical protein VFL82_03155 [Thermomicrobiales bacterium]|nr:hypothetical protein [Thermomicrobiales bacterium]